MPEATGAGGYVSVAVPKERVIDVYRFLAESGVLAEREDEDLEDDEKRTDWPSDLVKRMYRESPASMQAILKVLADRAGETVFSGELLKPLTKAYGEEATRAQLAGALGAFGRRVFYRYDRGKLPFSKRWNHERGENGYRMDPELAETIKDMS